MNSNFSAVAVTALVVVHHAIALQHGGAHTDLAIVLAPWQNAFVNAVIVAMPFVGAILLWTRYAKVGLWLVVIGMTGALVFGVFHHYMMVSPDHISHLPEGSDHAHGTFIWTAGAIAMLECVTTAVAAYFVGVGEEQA